MTCFLSLRHIEEKYLRALQGLNVQAPSGYFAAEGRQFNKSELIARFRHELQHLIKSMDKWSEQQLSKYILPHPALDKMTIRELLYFTIFHTTHHLNILKEKYDLKTEKVCSKS